MGGIRAALAIAACSAAAGLGAQAHAQDPLEGPKKVIAATAESVQRAPDEVAALLRGDQSATATASNLLCPPVSSIDDLLQEHLGQTPAGPLGSALSALTCSAGLLEFDFYTRWVGPDGDTLARTTHAVLGVPVPLDVDSDPEPDLTGTITLTDTETLAMVVERLPGEAGNLPVSVEAVLTDATSRVIGRRHLAFGYDARHDRAPGRFALSTPLATLLEPDGQYRFDLAQQDRGEAIALTGSLFDGGIGERTNPSEMRLAYGRSPDQATIHVQTGEGVTAHLTTDRPGPAELSGRLAHADAADQVAIDFEDLPSQLTLRLDSATGKVTYDASAPMERLTARIDTAQASFLGARHFDATLLEVPAAFTLEVGQDDSALTLSTDETIGQIDLRARSENRSFPELPAGEAGAALDSTGGELGLAFRVFELRHLRVALDPMQLEAHMQGGRVFTVDARIGRESGTLEAAVVLDKLPSQVAFALDSQTGRITYQASEPMDRLSATVRGAGPVLMGASDVDVQFLAVPPSFALTVGQDSGTVAMESDEPIGQIDIRAASADRPFPEIPHGEAGAIFDNTEGGLQLALRVFQLRHLAVALEPVAFEARMQAGRRFVADVNMARTDDAGAPLPPIRAAAVIDELPANFSLRMDDLEPAPAGPGGSALRLTGSAPISFLRLAVDGVALLEGTDRVEVEMDDVPTELEISLPEEGDLAVLTASEAIGQLRLAASDGATVLPGATPGNDLFSFRSVPGDVQVGVRLTAVEQLAISLDPVKIALRQDGARARPVDIDAALPAEGGPVSVTGLLDRPGDRTSLSVELDPGQPARLIFDNSHSMEKFTLNATGLSGISEVAMTFDNLSRRMSICMDPGPLCQRPNPHSVARYSTPNTTRASMNFDDLGTHGNGSGSAFRTTLNARIAFGQGDPLTITNLRFRNLGFDFADSNNPHGSDCGTAPRISMFFDSRGHPFVINSLKYPPSIVDFRIGSDSNPARASNRIARVNGWRTGFGGCLGGFDTSTAGGLSCGGQQNLTVKTALGNINVLNFLGFQLLPLCGGTVSNQQPW